MQSRTLRPSIGALPKRLSVNRTLSGLVKNHGCRLVAAERPRCKTEIILSASRLSSNFHRRFFASETRDPRHNLAIRAKDFLDRNESNKWTEKEVAQANSLNLTLLQQHYNATASSMCDDDNENETFVGLASKILQQWIQESSASNVTCSGLLDMLHRVVNTMKDSDKSVYVMEALHLVNQMESIPDESQRPDAKAFTMVLNMLSSVSDSEDDAELAEQLFQRSMDRGGREDIMMWNSYLHVLSKCSITDHKVSEKAEEILKEMISPEISVTPDSKSFAIVLHALANSGRPDRAQALLNRMLDMSKESGSTVQITETMVNTCIDAFAKQGNGERAEALLQDMISQSQILNIKPSVVTFSSVINAWAKSRHPDAGERAEDLLIRMENMDCPPSTESYTAAIDAWSRSKKPWATKRAQALLQTMETQYVNGNELVHPSITAYASIIHGLANSSDPKAARDAEEILEQMKQISATGRRDFTLNTIVYSTVIDVLAKSMAPDAHKRALALLREMQERAKIEGPQVAPNDVTYNSVISAFARRGEVSVARMLLDEMIDLSTLQGVEHIAPDTISYSAVLNAYSKWKDEQAPVLAMELLEKMQAEYNGGNHRVKPNTIAYTSAISTLAHSKSSSAPIQAEALLKEMQDSYLKGNKDMQPNSYSLGATLQVWTSSDEAQAPERAASLLKWAEKESEAGNRDLKPNRICYNHLLAIWAKSGREEALTRVREVMLNMSKSNDNDIKPDVRSYVRLMDAIQQARLRDTPKQQLRIIKGLLNAYENGDELLKPNTRSFNLALIACATVRDSRASGDTCDVLQEMGEIILSTQDWVPQSMTYRIFFDACSKSGFQNRALIDKVYEACKETRKMNYYVEERYESLNDRRP